MRIEVDRLDKTFFSASHSPVPVTHDLTFTLEEREFLCIVGPSGCGKTTLLALLAGLEPADGGSVRFRGARTATGPLTTIVWQEYALIPWRTVLDNVAFGLELRGIGRAKRVAAAREQLQLMEIGEFESKYPHQLSGGMRQRVGIARALTNDPEILLMDEPFAAVDAQTRVVLQEELLTLWSRDKKGVVFITHHIEEALLLGDRILVFSQRPTHVVEEIRVPFARPRDTEVERDPRFAELKLHIWHLLRDQRQPESSEEAEIAAIAPDRD